MDYFHGGEKPYLISGADDRLVKIWDYQVHVIKRNQRALRQGAKNMVFTCPRRVILAVGQL